MSADLVVGAGRCGGGMFDIFKSRKHVGMSGGLHAGGRLRVRH